MNRNFKNARELQQVLIPDTLPSVPGFTVTSAYRPAQQVGGDFFQIIPVEGGSTLVILGDVSGKGLKAAMAVSLIVGAMRALADDYPDPAQLLTQLNRRLYGRLQGGFATCLIMLLRADSTCVVASAGHPAPFLNRDEIDLPGALPLGISASTTYAESEVSVRPATISPSTRTACSRLAAIRANCMGLRAWRICFRLEYQCCRSDRGSSELRAGRRHHRAYTDATGKRRGRGRAAPRAEFAGVNVLCVGYRAHSRFKADRLTLLVRLPGPFERR